MLSVTPRHPLTTFISDVQELFYQRTRICLWLGVVFFSLFAALDLFCCGPQFSTFLLYRAMFVALLLCFLNLMKIEPFKQYTKHMIFSAMLLGSLAISLMTVKLGGFYSDYFVGILLMIAGALSALPLRAFEAAGTGLIMYCIYIITVLIGTRDFSTDHFLYMASNSFFFFSLITISGLQSHDDLLTHIREFRTKRSIRNLRKQLVEYTDNLEDNIQVRLIAQQENNLKYEALYNNIQDLIILVNSVGQLHKINQQCLNVIKQTGPVLLEQTITSLLSSSKPGKRWFEELKAELDNKSSIQGMQLILHPHSRPSIEVELSGSKVPLEDGVYYQLVLRDISITKGMERRVLDSQRLLDTSRQAAIFGLAKLAECRDDDTGAHLSRIQTYTRILATELAKTNKYQDTIDDQFIENLQKSSVLHDIGKVGIPDSILLKPGKLNEEEFEFMKQHTIFGSDVLSAASAGEKSGSFLEVGRDIARSHHERWDASGYPDGLHGTEIPLPARIIAVADVYDALTSTRVYKPPFSHKESAHIIIEQSGKQFDPAIVSAFIKTAEMFKESRIRLVLQQEAKQNDPA